MCSKSSDHHSTRAFELDPWLSFPVIVSKCHVPWRFLRCKQNLMSEATWLAHGVTALYVAAQNGHLKVMNRLLEAGADAKAVKSNGWTALHVAAQKGHLGVVNLLLGLGFRPDDLDYASMSPFHLAAQCGRVEVMEAFLQASGDPWLLDGFGLNVLDWASKNPPACQAMRALYSDYQPTEPCIYILATPRKNYTKAPSTRV
jgi:hypothetical protein